MTRLGGDYFISHEIRISNETTRIQWKVRGFFFVAHLDLQSGINSHILGFATCKMLGKSSTKWWWKMVMIYHGTSSKKPPKHESRHIICLYIYILKKVNFCLPKAVPRKLSPGGSGSLVFHPILSNGLCSFQAISYHMEKVMVFWRCLFVSFVESNVPNLLQTCGSCVFECISYLEFPQVQISKKVRPNLKAPNLQKNSQNS